MPPVDYYLSKSVDSLKGDERNIAVLARVYNNLPLDYIKRREKNSFAHKSIKTLLFVSDS